MSAPDDEPVVVRLPFLVACELEETLVSHLFTHEGKEMDGVVGIRDGRLAVALAAVREGLRPLMLPEDAPANVIPLRPRGAR